MVGWDVRATALCLNNGRDFAEFYRDFLAAQAYSKTTNSHEAKHNRVIF